MVLYSASLEDLETVFCFLDLHETKASSKNIQYPVTDFLVSVQEAQSESVKPFRCRLDLAGKNKPCPGEALIYLSMGVQPLGVSLSDNPTTGKVVVLQKKCLA